jgi:uncharacterized protein YbjT (DUF2867 family)
VAVVLVTGGTGTFGRCLVPILTARRHDVRVLSRQPGRGTHLADLATGAGLAQATAGADLVVHAASDARARRQGRTDPAQTQNLLAAAGDCRHLIYLSIVGVDAIPARYYRNKLACEQLVAGSPVPSTTLRATQFHELMEKALAVASRWPVAALPLRWRFQSVAAAEVAARVADLLEGEPLRRAPDFGGPEVLTVGELVRAWRHALGRPLRVTDLRWPGRVYQAFASGLNTCPDHADGSQTWDEYLRVGTIPGDRQAHQEYS